MPRVLADGHIKFTILTTAPANPAAPTITELNAGLDLSCKVLTEGFSWGATDSDKVAEKALCDIANANSLGASNYALGFTIFRYYLVAGGVDTTADAGFAAVKVKGTTLWGYTRKSSKFATDAWAAADEIPLGAEFAVDSLQDPGGGGWIKYRVPCENQRAYPWIAAAAGA
jgi:hypothetical protein